MINFELVTTPKETMEPNSLYLDGAFRGTVIDTQNNSYSFDHHDGLRFDKTATCFQVLMAKIQGLDFSKIKNIYISSIDADSVLSLMIATEEENFANKKFLSFIQDISRIDNSGLPAVLPNEKVYEVFYSLKSREETSMVLIEMLEKAKNLYSSGEIYNKIKEKKEEGSSAALNHQGKIIKFTTGLVNFSDVYLYGSWGFIYSNRKCTIGKKPFADVPSFKTLWDEFNKVEEGWGGADSIGGSPFKIGTKLDEVAILDVIQNWRKNWRKNDL